MNDPHITRMWDEFLHWSATNEGEASEDEDVGGGDVSLPEGSPLQRVSGSADVERLLCTANSSLAEVIAALRRSGPGLSRVQAADVTFFRSFRFAVRQRVRPLHVADRDRRADAVLLCDNDCHDVDLPAGEPLRFTRIKCGDLAAGQQPWADTVAIVRVKDWERIIRSPELVEKLQKDKERKMMAARVLTVPEQAP